MRNIIPYLILIICMSAASCSKELDFDYHDIDPITVIEASLTGEGAEVSITLTTPMDEPIDRTRLTDASVTLTDISGNTSSLLLPDAEGLYIGAYAGVSGHIYELKVERDGHTFTSQCEMSMPVEITGMKFNWIKMPYDHVAVLQVEFTDNPTTEGDCYWVRVYRNGEAYMWTAVTDNLSSGGKIAEVMMTSRMNLDKEDEKTALRDGDIVTAYVAKISRNMCDYLEAISNDSNGPAMFSGDFCLGYFLAAPLAKSSVIFHPDKIPYY